MKNKKRQRHNTSIHTPLTKPGAHGTLYKYVVEYTAGAGSPTFTWTTWAYDVEHAADKFFADNGGFLPQRYARATTGGKHTWKWHDA